MPVKINGASSGSVTLAAPSSGSDVTLTLPSDSIQPGMVLVTSQTFSAVSSVSVNNCFSAAYQNYRVVLNSSSSIDATSYQIRLRAAGSDATGANYAFGIGYVNTNTTGFNAGGSSGTSGILGYGWGANTTNEHLIAVEIGAPFVASVTPMTVFSQGGGINYGYVKHGLTNSYDGFTVSLSSGTISGTVRVYGYRNS